MRDNANRSLRSGHDSDLAGYLSSGIQARLEALIEATALFHHDPSLPVQDFKPHTSQSHARQQVSNEDVHGPAHSHSINHVHLNPALLQHLPSPTFTVLLT